MKMSDEAIKEKKKLTKKSKILIIVKPKITPLFQQVII